MMHTAKLNTHRCTDDRTSQFDQLVLCSIDSFLHPELTIAFRGYRMAKRYARSAEESGVRTHAANQQG
jgi:hypothetical protein